MNTPKIRFKGFTDDWEQRKVGDQMYIKSRIGWQALTKQEYLSEGDYYLITGTDIDETTHRVDLKRSYYVSKERYEMDSKIQVKEGDIIVTKDGTIGKVAMVTGLDKPATLNSHLFVLRDMAGKLDNHFLLHILNSHMFNHFVKSTKTGSTLTGLPQKTFVEFAFSCPKYEEQKLLSNYFDRLDHLITLHQRKCDETKQLKKFMLQKMFPKNGEKNPEIRFKGFTDDWEQRKLGDVLKERTERAKGEEELLSVTIANGVIRQADSEKRNIASEDKRNYKVVKKGDIPYNSMRMWQGAVGNSQYDGIVSPAYTILVPTDEANDKFFMELFKKENSLQRFKRWSQGLTSDTWNLKYPALSTMQFFIPSIKEQKRIANCLQELDHLITLHQRKCEKLKELKKFMLQNMFV